jgi:hypothetical protein
MSEDWKASAASGRNERVKALFFQPQMHALAGF